MNFVAGYQVVRGVLGRDFLVCQCIREWCVRVYDPVFQYSRILIDVEFFICICLIVPFGKDFNDHIRRSQEPVGEVLVSRERENIVLNKAPRKEHSGAT